MPRAMRPSADWASLNEPVQAECKSGCKLLFGDVCMAIFGAGMVMMRVRQALVDMDLGSISG